MAQRARGEDEQLALGLRDMPLEVMCAVIDWLDIMSAARVLATCKGLWLSSSAGMEDIRTRHASLVRTLRYNHHVCLLASRDTIRNNEGNGLRDLDSTTSRADEGLRTSVANRPVRDLRREYQVQARFIAKRLSTHGLRIASICTFGCSPPPE